MKSHKSCHLSELGEMQNGCTNCEAQKDLSSGAAAPISAIELQYNEHFKWVRICSEIKGQEQYIQLVKRERTEKAASYLLWDLVVLQPCFLYNFSSQG